MTERLSADSNDDWRTRRDSYNESSLQNSPVHTTQQSGTTYYHHNYDYNGYNYHQYDPNSAYKQRYKQRYNETMVYASGEDIKPIRRNQRQVPKTDNNQRKSDSDTSKNWRSTAKPLPPKSEQPYCHPEDRNGNKRKEFFTPYLSQSDIENGNFYQGIMRLTKNRDDAYVTVEDLDSDIYIGGAFRRNRSLQGDLVAVRLLDNIDEIWNNKKERDAKKKRDRELQIRKDRGSDEVLSKVDNENEDEAEKESESDEEKDDYTPKYCGEVVGILLRLPDATYPGYISLHKHSNLIKNDNTQPNGQSNQTSARPNLAWFRPTDKRVPFLMLRKEDVPKDLIENEEYYNSRLFSTSIRRWQITDTFPTGKIIKELGPVGDLLAEKEALVSDNNVITTSFSPLSLRNLPELPWCIPEKEFKVRRDLRKKCIFSIDPSSAKDLDDALHIEQIEDGSFEVGVHIADVAYFLRKGSALDNEARSRGTSTYLVDGVIPMLPSVLCEELCSLNPAVDRLAFSIIWKMDSNGEPIDTWFGKTIIRSCAKLSYEDAQSVIEEKHLPQNAVIHDGHNPSTVALNILLLNSIAVQKRRKRYENGSLSLNSVKLNFDLNEYGEPIAVHQFIQKDANRLIEEFMLSANISVAQKITQSFPEEALLRRHEEPLERRLANFLRLTDALGLDFQGDGAGDLQQSFNKIVHKDVKEVLLVLAIRCMQRAKYFCSGVADISKYGHYALNEPLYTHFTSPIRRYADVTVHRMLECALEGKGNSRLAVGMTMDADICVVVDHHDYEKKSVQKIAFNCNSKKDGARGAQDASVHLYLSRYLFNLEMTSGYALYAKGLVISVGKAAYEVYVPKFGLERKIFLEGLPTEKFEFDKSTYSLNIFWKQGVPVTMHNEEQIYARERVRKDNYSDDEKEEEDDFVEELSALKVIEERIRKSDDELDSPVVLDASTGLQRLNIFASIDVRLQVNMTVSPPIINIYPVNPYSGEKVAHYV